MNTLIVLIASFLSINVLADVYPEFPNQGDSYIKVSKNKSGFVRFQKCEIPTSQITNSCDFEKKSCQIGDIEKENCSEVLNETSRIFYSPKILTNIAKYYKSASTTGATLSILFLLGAGLLKTVEYRMASQTITKQVLSGQKLVLADSNGRSSEDITLIEKRGKYLFQSMNDYIRGLKIILKKYNIDHQKTLKEEKN